LGGTNAVIDEKSLKKYSQSIKTNFKRFIMVPFNVNNRIIEKMIGNIPEQLVQTAKII